MKDSTRDDWLGARLDELRPGWRGRLRIAAPEEAESAATEVLAGTVVEGPEPDRDPDSDALVDASVEFCTNYRDGRFVPVEGEPRVTIRVSQVVAMEPIAGAA